VGTEALLVFTERDFFRTGGEIGGDDIDEGRGLFLLSYVRRLYGEMCFNLVLSREMCGEDGIVAIS